MQWLIHHLARGDLFVVAAAALASVCPWMAIARKTTMRLLAVLVAVLSVTLISLCSIPLPRWSYAFWMGCAASAMLLALPRRVPIRLRVIAAISVVVFPLGSLLWELRWHRWAGIPVARAARVYVIGDSLSAGMGRENGRTWPRVLQLDHGIEVVDLAVAGATTSSIVSHLRGVTFDDGLVILEIGGNDVFVNKDPAAFERDLEALVCLVEGSGRQLLMFELPLYPLQAEYGRVQRRVAQRHHIALVPRRMLADIIIAPGNTIEDGIHLSTQGQQRMAELVWTLIAPALPPGPAA